MAERTRGMGRGLAAILSSTVDSDAGAGAAVAPGGSHHGEPATTAAEVRRGWPRRARALTTRPRDPAAGARAARGRGHLRADRRRAPLARGAARRARDGSGAGPAARRRHVARAGADREHGPRGPQSRRGGARGGGAGGRARSDDARTSAAGSDGPAWPSRISCDSSTCRTRRSTCSSAASCRRGTAAPSSRRPDHATRRRLAREAAANKWSVRETEVAARNGRRGQEITVRRLRSAHPDQLAMAERLGEAFGRALGADVRVTPKADGYRVSMAFSSLDDALEAATRLGVMDAG